jgi:hypothetical protein
VLAGPLTLLVAVDIFGDFELALMFKLLKYLVLLL